MMSQTSPTPGHVQSHDSSQEEIQRLKEALGKTQTRLKVLSKELERERAERLDLLEDNKGERVSGHETSGGQIAIQQWRDRTEEAERRALEAEHRAEEADKAVLCMREEHFPDLMQRVHKAMVKQFTQKMNELDASAEPEVVPEAKGEVDGQIQASAQASKGEESDKQDEDGDLTSEGEEVEYQSHKSLRVSEEVASTYDPAQEITEVEYAARQVYDTSSTTYGGAQVAVPPSPTYEHEIRSSIEYDYQGGASKPRVCIPATVDSPQQLSTGDLKGTSSQPSSLPSPSMLSQPQKHQSSPHQVGKMTRPIDQHTPSANDSGKISNAASPLEKLGDMQEALPTLSGSSKPMKQDFPNLPKGSSQIPGISTASTILLLKKPTIPA